MSRINYPPPSADELQLIQKLNPLGAQIVRLDDFIRCPEKHAVTRAIAEQISIELGEPHDINFLAIIMEILAVPEFRNLMLPHVVKIAKRGDRDNSATFAINNLARILLPQDAAVVADLLCDPAVGRARSLLVPIYARLAKTSSIPILRKIANDPVTRTYALHHLSMLGDLTIEPELIILSKDPESWKRKIAVNGLKRLLKIKNSVGNSKYQ